LSSDEVAAVETTILTVLAFNQTKNGTTFKLLSTNQFSKTSAPTDVFSWDTFLNNGTREQWGN